MWKTLSYSWTKKEVDGVARGGQERRLLLRTEKCSSKQQRRSLGGPQRKRLRGRDVARANVDVGFADLRLHLQPGELCCREETGERRTSTDFVKEWGGLLRGEGGLCRRKKGSPPTRGSNRAGKS